MGGAEAKNLIFMLRGLADESKNRGRKWMDIQVSEVDDLLDYIDKLENQDI